MNATRRWIGTEAMKNSNAKLNRQKSLAAEMIAANRPELEILKTKSAATLRVVQIVKRVWPRAKVAK
ncbi:MAG: hypothetical protein LUO89_06380 [Methanothrix sp.]|nr:hypothetical protein [Methanothrix sp.]